jgi:hypothetical protein
MINAVDKEAALALSPLRMISAVDKEAALTLNLLKMIQPALVAVKVKIPNHLAVATMLLQSQSTLLQW